MDSHDRNGLTSPKLIFWMGLLNMKSSKKLSLQGSSHLEQWSGFGTRVTPFLALIICHFLLVLEKDFLSPALSIAQQAMIIICKEVL